MPRRQRPAVGFYGFPFCLPQAFSSTLRCPSSRAGHWRPLACWPLLAMGYGIELMIGAADWVASWPRAVTIVPTLSGLSLALIALGGLWLCLWQIRMRTLGLAIAAAGLALAPISERPDLLIEREGATAALRVSDGALIIAWRTGFLPMGTTGTLATCQHQPVSLRPLRMYRPREGQDCCTRPQCRCPGRRLP